MAAAAAAGAAAGAAATVERIKGVAFLRSSSWLAAVAFLKPEMYPRQFEFPHWHVNGVAMSHSFSS